MNVQSLGVKVAGIVIAVCLLPVEVAHSDQFDGAYKGSMECEQVAGGKGMSRTSFSIIVNNGFAVAVGDMFDIDGRREYSPEIVTGKVDAQGVVNLHGTVFSRDATYQIDYTLTLYSSGGTLTGTQKWSRAVGGNGVTRTCKGTFFVVGSPRQ